jgi:hypothetical protein
MFFFYEMINECKMYIFASENIPRKFQVLRKRAESERTLGIAMQFLASTRDVTSPAAPLQL